jgi:hypothetical protein
MKIEQVGRYRTACIRTKIVVPMKMMTNGQGQPTKNAEDATMKMTGTKTMTFDTNFAIAEGQIARSKGEAD